ncbi:DUF6894 family protein [Roseomonas elaeocarpi]|uniref:DUF6894 family protein n=1 Tax=Roseomonas elaeocarpi TaxID=907779 RepID=A0ABV6JSX9_9PROT
MPRYVFETLHSVGRRDDEARPDACRLSVTTVEAPDPKAAIREAVKALPHLARQVDPTEDEKRTSVILVKNECGMPLYSATLNFNATWFDRSTAPSDRVRNASGLETTEPA